MVTKTERRWFQDMADYGEEVVKSFGLTMRSSYQDIEKKLTQIGISAEIIDEDSQTSERDEYAYRIHLLIEDALVIRSYLSQARQRG